MSDHNSGKQSGVHETRYGTCWPWYDQFKVGWLQPPQLWLSAWISWVVPVLALRDKDLGHAYPHAIWLEPITGCRNWQVASNLCSEHMPEGQYHGQAYLLLAGQLFHFPQCHKGLVSSRNENMCLCHSVRYSCTSGTKLREFHYIISR